MSPQDRRKFWRNGLSTLYLPYYDKLCGELDLSWAPYVGYRSFTMQDQLYAEGRTRPGPNATAARPLGDTVTRARGGESAHCFGAGSDWAWFDQDGKLQWIPKGDPRWQIYKAAVEKVGLKWGGDFSDVDHNELKIACDWKHILLTYKQVNMTAAQEHIARAMVRT